MTKPVPKFAPSQALPPYPKAPTLLGGEADRLRYEQELASWNAQRRVIVMDDVMAKLGVLASRYGLSEDDIFKDANAFGLLLRVATEFVPGFAFKTRKVRSVTEWPDWELLRLHEDVTALVAEKDCSVIQACIWLHERGAWGEATPKTLSNYFHVSKSSSFVQILEALNRFSPSHAKTHIQDIRDVMMGVKK